MSIDTKAAEKATAQAQQAWNEFQAGNIGNADKLARQAVKSGVPFARSVTRRINEVIGAAVVAAERAKKKK